MTKYLIYFNEYDIDTFNIKLNIFVNSLHCWGKAMRLLAHSIFANVQKLNTYGAFILYFCTRRSSFSKIFLVLKFPYWKANSAGHGRTAWPSLALVVKTKSAESSLLFQYQNCLSGTAIVRLSLTLIIIVIISLKDKTEHFL